MEDPYAALNVDKRTWIPQMHRRSIPLEQVFNPKYNTPNNFRMGKESRDGLQFLHPIRPQHGFFDSGDDTNEENLYSSTTEINPKDLEEFIPMLDYIYKFRTTTENLRDLPMSDRYRKLKTLLDEFSSIERPENIDIQDLITRKIDDEDLEEESKMPDRFDMNYNTPDRFRAGWESRDLLDEDISEPRVYVDETDEDYPEEYGSGSHTESDEVFRELKQLQKQEIEDELKASPRYSNEDEIFRELKHIQKNEDRGHLSGRDISRKFEKTGNVDAPGLYTEGGVVYAPEVKTTGK